MKRRRAVFPDRKPGRKRDGLPQNGAGKERVLCMALFQGKMSKKLKWLSLPFLYITTLFFAHLLSFFLADTG